MLVKFKGKSETGSISLYVLISMLFFLIILIALFVNANNKVQTQQRELEKVQSEYGKEDINDVYQEELIGDDGINTIGYDKEKEVNSPKITSSTDENTGLIPIKWNGSNWVVCNEDDPEWYNYSAEDIQVTAEDGTTQTVPAMTWANAMLSDGTLKKGTAQPGDVVPDTQEGSMFVWIPRYAYSINKYKTDGPGDEANGTTQGITTVEFLKGNTNIGSSGTEYPTDYDADSVAVGTATPMIVHPAFTFGGTNLTGIWVAKFEASMAETNNNTVEDNNVTNKTVKIVPNVESWRYIQIGNIFTNCLNMKNNEIYKMASGTDSHLMKNSEWGAITYLAASQYGVIPAKNGSGTSYTEDETTKYHSYTGNKNYKGNTNQSTTGNISGVYDMNGGAWEYVAAYWDNGSPYLGASNQGTSTYFPSNKLDSKYSAYWDRYESSQYEIENGANIWNNYAELENDDGGNKGNYKIAKNRVDLMKNIKGDAMYEAIKDFSYYGRNPENSYGEAWMKATAVDENGELTSTSTGYGLSYYNGDFTLVGTYYQPFLLRGSSWYSASHAGVFASAGNDGHASHHVRFSSCTRVVAS